MAVKNKVLVLFAHPALEKSRVNVHLLQAAKRVEGVSVRDLYELYPDFQVAAAAEQETLLEHDVIVFHHPFFWYNCPALLKEWMDHVLVSGFAYGHGGTRLKGKVLVSAITTGGPEDAYQRGGINHFTLRELLAPFEQTARLCGMRYLPPYAIQGTVRLTEPGVDADHAQDYEKFLSELRDRVLDLGRLDKLPHLRGRAASR